MKPSWAFPLTLALVPALICLRLCHAHLLWADEDYHLAAAINILHGKVPYRDFWYDKPPLAAFYYLLIGGHAGWLLRLLDAGYASLACFLAYRLASDWWGAAEGCVSAVLLAFFLTFYLPSAVIPFAADAIMLVPHLAAVYFTQRQLPFWAGISAGIAFLANTKAVFVLATCFLWLFPQGMLVIVGFALPVLVGFVTAGTEGAWADYVEQVWQWGFIYAAGSPVLNPLRTGWVRTMNWAGFHAVLVMGTTFALLKIPRSERWKLGVWLALSFVAVTLGSRFAPHYFLQLLPAIVIAASRGILLAWRSYGFRAVAVFTVLLLVPLVRFGPRYISILVDDVRGREPRWADVAMDLDSQHVAVVIGGLAHPGDTLFVWGYRPDIYVYTRLISDSRFWDSQPLDGVPADRHLSATTAIYSGPAVANRKQLIRSHPALIVDGLGLMNPKLAIGVYPELRLWLDHYKLVGRTAMSLIYRRID